jgi:O-antigen/teichoic acid export membrane protein
MARGPHKPRALRHDFAWVLAGNVLYSACQWAIVMVLAKLGTPAQVGEYALGLAVSAPVILFASFQLRSLIASDVREQFTPAQYLGFRSASQGIALAIVALIAMSMRSGTSVAAVIVWMGVAQTLEFAGEVYYGFMQRNGRMDLVAWSLMIKGPLALATLCLGMWMTHSVVWAVIGLCVGRFIVLVLFDVRFGFAGTRMAWDSGKQWSLLKLAMPLGIISMLVTLNASLPRYFVEGHLGAAELGIFSAIASLLRTGNLVVSAFGQSILQPVARACADVDRSRFRRYAFLATALAGMLGGAAVILSAAFGREILSRVFRPEYGDRADILVLLTIAGTIAFIASGLGYVITGARSLGPQIPLQIAVAIAGASVSTALIPTRGLRGAAEATLAAAIVQFVGTAVLVWKVDRALEPPPRTEPAPRLSEVRAESA